MEGCYTQSELLSASAQHGCFRLLKTFPFLFKFRLVSLQHVAIQSLTALLWISRSSAWMNALHPNQQSLAANALA